MQAPAAMAKPRPQAGGPSNAGPGGLPGALAKAIRFRRSGPLAARLGVGAVVAGAAAAGRWMAMPLSGVHLAYAFFYPAVAIAWLLGGWPAALAATALSAFLEHFWLSPLTQSVSVADLVVFLVNCLVVAGLADGLQRAQRRLVASDTQLRIEAAKHAAEQRLRLLVEATREYAIIMLDAEGRITSWNEGARRNTGYEADEVLGRHVSVFYTADEIATGKPERDLAEARDQGRLEEEGERVRKDGTHFWTSTVMTPLLDASGKLDGFLRINRDITERRRMEQEAAEIHARLESVVNSAMDAIITVDADQRIVLFNPAAEIMFGRAASEVIGQPLDGLLPERYRSSHAGYVRSFAEARISNRTMGRLGEISGVRSNREEFPIEASISQSEVLGRKLLTVILRDVTERKRAELALMESDERMRLALKASNAGVWAWDTDSDHITVDGAYRVLYGFNPGELINAARWEERVHPDDRASLRQQVEWCIENDGQWREEFRIRHPVLGERWLTGRARVLFGKDGEITGMTGITFDVTERKRAEDHMRFVMRELSHRTKNILAVVQAMAWQSSQGNVDTEEFLERFTRRIESLRRSHDLLVKREWEGVELADLVRGQLSPFLDEAARRLTISGPHLLVKPSGAEDLGLVLHELATNASKYGALSVPEGRVLIEWEIRAAEQGQPYFAMTWQERGGPRVEPPAHTGFGSTVIRDMLAMTKKARITIGYEPTGLVWRLEVLAERLLDGMPCIEDLDVDTGSLPSKLGGHSYEI